MVEEHCRSDLAKATFYTKSSHRCFIRLLVFQMIHLNGLNVNIFAIHVQFRAELNVFHSHYQNSEHPHAQEEV